MAHRPMTLVIANKVYSSWSLRPWVIMDILRSHHNLVFDEVILPLGQPDTKDMILRYSPSGKVPALCFSDGRVVWESLAIMEMLSELYPEARFWPHDPHLRALARSAAHEMHAGFVDLRKECPMNLRRVHTPLKEGPSERVEANLRRLHDLWSLCMASSGAGPFLFGDFGIVDAMYLPVATRIRSYGLHVPPKSQAYVEALLGHPSFLRWEADAANEVWTYPSTDHV